MNEEQAQQVADNLEATPELLPYLGELLADLWELGSDPDVAVDFLRPLDLAPESTRVLDLACGKGPLAITLAFKLGFRVDGVDLYPPFIDEARQRADAAGVGERCRFEVGDLRQRLAPDPPYDVVAYASVGVLGALDEAVGRLRRAVRAGGYLLIDDGFLVDEKMLARVGYEHYAPHEETRQCLTRHGDRILREERLAPEELRRVNLENTANIRRRAEQLSERRRARAGCA